MSLQRRQWLACSALSLLAMSQPSWARLKIDITGVGGDQVPIVIKPFLTNGPVPVDVPEMIRQDLMRTGNFRLMDSVTPEPLETMSQPADLKDWAQQGASIVVTGGVNQVGPRRWDFKVFVHDAVSGELMQSYTLSADTADLSGVAHQIADRIYNLVTGYGAFLHSPLMYVTQVGPNRYDLVMTNSDGEDPVTVLQSREPIISPTFMPNGRQVLYVSFEHQKPEVILQDLASGQRRVLASYEGNNSAPAVSPDGQTIAVALSRGGRTQIWTMNRQGAGLKRFTQSYGIDTEPAFSPDGQMVYFTSDRGGSPQIYRQPLNGGAAERVTFNEGYAISPTVSPDGKTLAYVAKKDGRYRVAVMDLASGQTHYVTNTTQDESPSFSPNGRYLIYATKRQGKGVLGMASVDGRVNVVLSREGDDIREPEWGPLYR